MLVRGPDVPHLAAVDVDEFVVVHVGYCGGNAGPGLMLRFCECVGVQPDPGAIFDVLQFLAVFNQLHLI